MKWSSLLCAAISLLSDTSLNGQIKAKPESILIHSTMQLDGGHSLGMVVSSKEQKYIRATIHNQKKTAGATIIYDGKVIALVEGETFQTTARVLSGAEAAANLFDLIALNPEYHFKKFDGFNFKTPAFKAYRLELQMEAKAFKETERYRPIKALLYEEHDAGSTLLRSIKYISFFDLPDPYLQPRELTFTDESTGEIGRISVQKVEYNVGLPDFLFDLGDESDK